MRYIAYILVVLFIGFCAPKAKAQIQYPIPSFDVELIQVNTSFEETSGLSNLSKPGSREERQLLVQASDDNPAQNSWAVVIIYSLDGQDQLGPYTVYEGATLSVAIDERQWGVKVMDFLPGCIVSVWIE